MERSFWSEQASSNAAAIPTIAGRFSVPARFPRSCPPPSIRFVKNTPVFAYSTPIPFGPLNLCADKDSMSTWSSSTLMGRWPTACTASVWNNTPFCLHTAPISRIGWIVPISLLAYITVTSAVSGRIAFSTCAGLTIPFSPTSRSVISKPSFSNFFNVCKTAWCSNAVEIICIFPCLLPIAAADKIAWLSASLPPEVK